MIDTARLIITFDCNRNCLDCCNKTDPSVKSAEIINDLSALKDYNYICITGGEPMLNPKRTLKIIHRLKYDNSDVILYLYSAWCNNECLLTTIDFIDGLHYTLHYPLEESDRDDFGTLQMQLEYFHFRHKSFRLYIDNRIDKHLTIYPNHWDKVEIKPWMKECMLPTNEKLFILEDNYNG